ncbi:MAG TPA: DNA polymerase IV [Solirubrobacterales bacterium]|nr:DNA polymerase IV [Solirubrobacterales bacterium]
MSANEPSILHADADAFFASVEQRDDPSLRGRPVIVGGGVVMAASYEARRRGVRGAMNGARARRLCPDAVVVPPRFSAYVRASEQLFELFAETSPVVEGLSLEEAFLDVRGLERISGTPSEIAATLRRRARERIGLPVTVGIARTKTLAKMASRAAKPDGLLLVAPAREREFLHPLPVEALWGVGDSTARKLRGAGIETVGQLAELSEPALATVVGRAAGRHLHAVARNRDPRRVRSGRRRRSFGSQSALGRWSGSARALDAVVVSLADRITRRMRAAASVGRTVTVRLRFGDYTRASRARTMPTATAATSAVLTTARAIVAAAMPVIRRRGLTLIGLTITNLERGRPGEQLELPFEERARDGLDRAVDELRDRFGVGAITRGTLLGMGDRAAARLRTDRERDEALLRRRRRR